MRRAPIVLLAAGALIAALLPVPVRAAGAATPAPDEPAANDEKVPLYTNADLDRMFGPSSPEPTKRVADTTPEDWSWVEKFLDRQYARIDADRQHDLDRRSIGWGNPTSPSYVDYPVAWSLGYPASVWWTNVYGAYSRALYPRYGARPGFSPGGRPGGTRPGMRPGVGPIGRPVRGASPGMHRGQGGRAHRR